MVTLLYWEDFRNLIGTVSSGDIQLVGGTELRILGCHIVISPNFPTISQRFGIDLDFDEILWVHLRILQGICSILFQRMCEHQEYTEKHVLLVHLQER